MKFLPPPGSFVSGLFSSLRWGICFTLLLLAGCQSTEPEHEAEHIIPAHKPSDFVICVDRLSGLREEIASPPTRSEGEIRRQD